MKTVKIQLNEIIKTVQDMRVEFNKELEPLLKKTQIKIKCKMKNLSKNPQCLVQLVSEWLLPRVDRVNSETKGQCLECKTSEHTS